MSGAEHAVRLLTGRPYEERPLRRRGEKIGRDAMRCPLCRSDGLGLDYAPHALNPGHYVVKAWCRGCGHGHRNYYAAMAEAIGMSTDQIDAGNDGLLARYPHREPAPAPSQADAESWHRSLLADPRRLSYVVVRRGLSRRLIGRYMIGHDGDRYTLPVYDWQSHSPEFVNLRRYLPGGDPKMLSLAGAGAQLYTPVPAGRSVVVCEGEWDALRALSLGIPAVTNTGGASTWRDEWSELIGRRHVFVTYDSDRGGRLGERRVVDSFERVGLRRSLTVVHLPQPFRLKHGADLTDYLRTHTAADLRALLRRTFEAQHARSPGSHRGSRRARSNVAGQLREEVGS